MTKKVERGDQIATDLTGETVTLKERIADLKQQVAEWEEWCDGDEEGEEETNEANRERENISTP